MMCVTSSWALKLQLQAGSLHWKYKIRTIGVTLLQER
jgi:hypothetical protein